MGDGTDMYEFEIQAKDLQDLVGPFYLCYYSYQKDCIIGYSDMFKVSSRLLAESPVVLAISKNNIHFWRDSVKLIQIQY